MAKRSLRRLPNVALLIETSRSFPRNVVRGVADYGRVHGPWLFYLPAEMPVRSLPSKEEWDGDGIIAQTHRDAKFMRQLGECGKPVVTLSGPPGAGETHCVVPNQKAVVELAFAHFRDRGFARYAYCGSHAERIWPPLGEFFRGIVEANGYRCDVYHASFDPMQ